MISTVTTAAAAATASPLAAGFGLTATITLIVLLITKELTGAAYKGIPNRDSTWVCALDGALNTGVIPLLLAFAVIVIVKVMSIL